MLNKLLSRKPVHELGVGVSTHFFCCLMGNETIYVLLSTCHTVFMIPGAIKKKVLNGFFGPDISIVSRRNYDS